ncbi:type II toxin-antitoxin system HicB family antitoxin [Pantoea sp. SIMBA_133]
MFYAAFVEVENDYSSSGFFPHVPGCIFACGNAKDTVENAISAIDAHFELLAEKGMQLPVPPMNWCIDKLSMIDWTLEVQNGTWIEFYLDIKKYSSILSDR